jgi:hypothetical protein
MRLPLAIAATLLAAAPAFAQEQRPQERPQAVTRMLQCRTIQAIDERLACYDREVAAFEAAASSRELVVYDREQLRRTRRSLFGITLPDLSIFGGGDDEDGVTQIESTIRGLRQDPYGKYTFTLEDGARWVQIDSREMRATPRLGQPIRIRRAMMGSYLANVGSQTAIRVRRVLPAD